MRERGAKGQTERTLADCLFVSPASRLSTTSGCAAQIQSRESKAAVRKAYNSLQVQIGLFLKVYNDDSSANHFLSI